MPASVVAARGQIWRAPDALATHTQEQSGLEISTRRREGRKSRTSRLRDLGLKNSTNGESRISPADAELLPEVPVLQ
jgi:hypothetical protein